MPEPGFLEMRASLADRGLIGRAEDGFPLTEVGNAHVDALMIALAEAEAPCDPRKPRVRWRFNRKGWSGRHG